MKVRICDLCKKQFGNEGDVKFKYKAKKRWYCFDEAGWEKLDICSECINKIIAAKEDV